jgi:hypothetical protein
LLRPDVAWPARLAVDRLGGRKRLVAMRDARAEFVLNLYFQFPSWSELMAARGAIRVTKAKFIERMRSPTPEERHRMLVIADRLWR